MNLNQATFSTSAPNLSRCPTDSIAEVAFAGRSNAGKSSALNRLTGIKNLARTSKTPGRTQLINFFTLDQHRYLVDLPGYGFAKVPVKVRQQWEKSLGEYLQRREALKGLIILMDIRHPMTANDRQMVAWSDHIDLPIHILLTKADKLKRGAAMAALHQVQGILKAEFPGITAQLFSATKGNGVDEAQQTILQWLNNVAES
jgi:GTP-binding protein